MSSLAIVVIVVVIVMALAMWAVYYIPLPPGAPAFIKPMLYVVIIAVAIIVILTRSGLAHAKQITCAETHHGGSCAQSSLR